MKQPAPEEYGVYVPVDEALATLLCGLPGKLVAIDGRDGSGKTTLGRYLAWRFNVTLIESDLFLLDGENRLTHRVDEI
jgi:ABC-type phosphate/phosphonate transport system ATPase subunit